MFCCPRKVLSVAAAALMLWLGSGLLKGVEAQSQNPMQAAPNERLEPYQRLYIDIDNDEKPESVGLVAYNHSQNGYLGQLVFFNDKDEVIWAGPRIKYFSGQALLNISPQVIMENALVFGKVGSLNYELKFVIDPDQDGKILVAVGEVPVGVQITSFRVLRWTGSEFKCVYKDCHLLEDPLTPGHYVWSNKPLHSYNSGYSDGRWVRDLRLTDKPNVLRAIIREIKHDFSGSNPAPKIRRGEALMEPELTGTKLVRWEHMLQKWFKID